MKTQDQFSALIQSAPFFKRVGNAVSADGVLALSSLAPWGDEANASDADNRIADEMDWLPTVTDQGEPFYPAGLDSLAKTEDELKRAKSYRREVHKAVLGRLRQLEMKQLKAGPHGFEEAAKGAAAYALRNAATEVVLGIEGKWLQVAEMYFKGHWPCGITRQGKLVVF